MPIDPVRTGKDPELQVGTSCANGAGSLSRLLRDEVFQKNCLTASSIGSNRGSAMWATRYAHRSAVSCPFHGCGTRSRWEERCSRRAIAATDREDRTQALKHPSFCRSQLL